MRNIRLRAVDGIKCLVYEQTSSPSIVDPWRAILVESGIVPEQGEEVGDDEHEPGQGDQVRGHPHGKALDDDIGVEGLENIFRRQRVVDAAVFVLLEVRQIFLPYVHHFEGRCRRLQVDSQRWDRIGGVRRFADGDR